MPGATLSRSPPPPARKARTRVPRAMNRWTFGQAGARGEIRCGDVLAELAHIPSATVHLAVTSPPYNVGLQYDAHRDSLPYEEYLDWTRRVWQETYRTLVPGGRFALNIAPTSIKSFRPIHHDFIRQLLDLGMIYRAEIMWYKQTMRKRTAWGSWLSPRNPHVVPSWEYVLVFSKERWDLPGDPHLADVTREEFLAASDGFWDIRPETTRRGHPAPFPEKLIYRLIKFYTYRGNTVLDMFGGTGTVATVAATTGRRFLHIDHSRAYCEVARRRVEKALSGGVQTRLID